MTVTIVLQDLPGTRDPRTGKEQMNVRIQTDPPVKDFPKGIPMDSLSGRLLLKFLKLSNDLQGKGEI